MESINNLVAPPSFFKQPCKLANYRKTCQPKTVAVLGNEGDYHAQHVLIALQEQGHDAFLLDTGSFAAQFKLSWTPQFELGKINSVEGSTHNFQSIDSVYWRCIDTPRIPDLKGKNELTIAQNDSFSLLKTLLYEPAIKWVNSLEAYQFHRVKPRQLALAKVIGAQIPKTIVSNNSGDIIEFSRQLPKAIFKPVQGGAHTEFLNQELLDEDRLNFALSYSPVTIQEYIPGTNVRTYVLGKKTFSAEINSEEVDFRNDANCELVPVQLPENIQQLSTEICRRFGMEWTAIDWRRDPQGNYFFLEANPSPMFYFFEQQTGFPITRELVNLLVA